MNWKFFIIFLVILLVNLKVSAKILKKGKNTENLIITFVLIFYKFLACCTSHGCFCVLDVEENEDILEE